MPSPILYGYFAISRGINTIGSPELMLMFETEQTMLKLPTIYSFLLKSVLLALQCPASRSQCLQPHSLPDVIAIMDYALPTPTHSTLVRKQTSVSKLNIYYYLLFFYISNRYHTYSGYLARYVCLTTLSLILVFLRLAIKHLCGMFLR